MICDTADGYAPLSSSITCPRNAVEGQAPSSPSCTPNQCAGITFGSLYNASGLTDSCAAGERLATHGRTNCTVDCVAGYTGRGLRMHCNRSSIEGAPATPSQQCVEHQCAPYAFGNGTMPDNATGMACTPGVRLSTHTASNCTVMCDAEVSRRAACALHAHGWQRPSLEPMRSAQAMGS